MKQSYFSDLSKEYKYKDSDHYNLRNSPEIPLTLEVHSSFWDEGLKDYEIRDLCPGGRLHEDTDNLPLNEVTRRRIKENRFHIHPVKPKYFMETGKYVSGYTYIMDTPHGMRIFHYQKPGSRGVNRLQDLDTRSKIHSPN